MDNSPNSRINYNDNAATLTHQQLRYGVASGAEVSVPASPSLGTLNFLEQLRYFYCEHLRGILFLTLSLIFIFAVPLALIRPEKMKAVVNSFVKRSIDIIGAAVGLLLTLPLFIVLPVLIKLDSSGPVFYAQLRVGINRRKQDRRYCRQSDSTERRVRDRRRQNCQGRPFHVIKFRTMGRDAEKKCGPVWATENDSRITWLGRILRKTRLDEIPQFINVLKGDMSLVGPRPERPSFVQDLSEKVEDYNGRLAVRPGLTGLAQVENGYDTSLASVVKKVNLDLEYIRHWSLWSDIKILFKTVIVVITGKGAC
jgi:lipopolysaccharide/colanic/teichoic acid biosynthesis glycosyltransferase